MSGRKLKRGFQAINRDAYEELRDLVRAAAPDRLADGAWVTFLDIVIGYTGRDGETFESRASLAADLGLSRNALKRRLAVLEKAGLVGWDGRTLRVLCLPELEGNDPSPGPSQRFP